MSEVKVNKISPRTACGTVTLGDSGDTFTIPSGATITNNGTQVGFGRTGTVDWQTGSIKTGTFTAVNGEGYFADTSSGAFTMNLPAGSAGAIVSVADYTRTFVTYNLTVSPDGSEKIGGVAADASLNVDGQSATFVYVDATEGWINVQETQTSQTGTSYMTATVSGSCNAIVTSGDYKTAIFKGPGNFCVSAIASCAANNKVDYLVVAGGGGGGGHFITGGGGAGGMRFFSTAPGCNAPINNSGASPNTEITVTASSYPIVVGASGAGGPSGSGSRGSSGGVSSFSTVPSAGGGGGGWETLSAVAGGSGGGENGYGPPSPGGCGGGAGNSPPTTPSQGNNGGAGVGAPTYYGGGGGGGGAVGSSSDGVGGAGSYIADPFIGPTAPSYGTPGPVSSTRYFAGGAGGGKAQPSPAPGIVAGGAGGGGTGSGNATTGGAGTINTGGGGGGTGNNSPGPVPGGAGGSGIVMIRYKFQ